MFILKGTIIDCAESPKRGVFFLGEISQGNNFPPLLLPIFQEQAVHPSLFPLLKVGSTIFADFNWRNLVAWLPQGVTMTRIGDRVLDPFCVPDEGEDLAQRFGPAFEQRQDDQDWSSPWSGEYHRENIRVAFFLGWENDPATRRSGFFVQVLGGEKKTLPREFSNYSPKRNPGDLLFVQLNDVGEIDQWVFSGDRLFRLVDGAGNTVRQFPRIPFPAPPPPLPPHEQVRVESFDLCFKVWADLLGWLPVFQPELFTPRINQEEK